MPATWAKIAYMMNNETKVPVNRPENTKNDSEFKIKVGV
jgi:hypothetical protein